MADNIFNFTEERFFYNIKGIEREIIWNEIEEIIAYKRDLWTTDEVCIDLILKDTIITFSEELKGWDLFIAMLMEKFPSIDSGWEWKIIQPPFETNLTTIFKK